MSDELYALASGLLDPCDLKNYQKCDNVINNNYKIRMRVGELVDIKRKNYKNNKNIIINFVGNKYLVQIIDEYYEDELMYWWWLFNSMAFWCYETTLRYST